MVTKEHGWFPVRLSSGGRVKQVRESIPDNEKILWHKKKKGGKRRRRGWQAESHDTKHRQLIGALPCQVIGWRCSKQRVGGPHHKRVLVAAKNNERYSITKHTHIPRKHANTRNMKKSERAGANHKCQSDRARNREGIHSIKRFRLTWVYVSL